MIREKIDKMVMLAMKHSEPNTIFGKTSFEIENVDSGNLTNALKQIKTELVNAEKSGKDFDEIAILKRLKKQHEESIETYKTNGRTDLLKSESDELVVIKMLLPEEVSASTIETVVNDIVETIKTDHEPTIKDIGPIMKSLKAKYPNVDGKVASEIIKKSIQ